jgi:hypothetical protein
LGVGFGGRARERGSTLSALKACAPPRPPAGSRPCSSRNFFAGSLRALVRASG